MSRLDFRVSKRRRQLGDGHDASNRISHMATRVRPMSVHRQPEVEAEPDLRPPTGRMYHWHDLETEAILTIVKMLSSLGLNGALLLIQLDRFGCQ